MSEGKQIPIPSNIVTMVKQSQTKRAIERMQVQLGLLTHLIGMLDPDHDYLFDEEELTLTKKPRKANEENKVQPGDSEDKPFRGEVPLNRETKGLLGVTPE
jgi:hypothetical protein